MIQIFKDVFGTYVVTWANDDKLVHTRQFHCHFDAKVYARQLHCRRELDRLLDELDRRRIFPESQRGECFH